MKRRLVTFAAYGIGAALISSGLLNWEGEKSSIAFEGLAKSTSPSAANSLPDHMQINQRFEKCGSAKRVNCIVDGDTLWISGSKIRIADINTPEVSNPGCKSEAQLAARATRRLEELVNAGPFELRSADRDEDKYGRKLRILHRNGKSLGDVLVKEGLAEGWTGRRRDWCGA